ncbi:unnamed protein product [Mycena citricolor]|uniref:RWD domain-containing protein n=1 Tax=Mycena citricolor TaxID=2018698 RepID=A0AAD2HYG3_9AGAR|nr:unnamed protein product [Mycena citricolor]
MSISPTSRDVVLAARRGLFIIDLHYPFEVPRFLPQGGTWDVADVQWNPHVSRSQYVVSTSAEKLLIWNLLLPYSSTASRTGGSSSPIPSSASSPSAIQHVLHQHYRAITDINWHPAEPDIVVSTSIDAWVWGWDLRDTRKPIWGLSAFGAGGTQVKWNRQDPDVLASSHGGETLIWDRRKGSMPITHLRAHRSKIYGIDWSPTRRQELVTCALDGEIKVWDIDQVSETVLSNSNSSEFTAQPHPHSSPLIRTSSMLHTPLRTIQTAYPVWRARHLPFGRGVLSLPQRGSTGLEMYALGEWAGQGAGPRTELAEDVLPVEVFEGHTDVVKEFVWRRGTDGDAFQLITWSKDRTLRLWPVDAEMMEKVGYQRPEEEREAALEPPSFSFRNPPVADLSAESSSTFSGSTLGPPPSPALFSAPISHGGARGILAGVLAGGPTGRKDRSRRSSPATPRRRPATSRMTPGGRKVGGLDALSWLQNVKEVKDTFGGFGPGRTDRSSSGGAASSGLGSELADVHDEENESLARNRSDSRGRTGEFEAHSLQDELTSVINKLPLAKIKLEKHDLKKRTCTLGLLGPWGETPSVFMRVTFTFPKDYPHGRHPHGTPTIELERNPLISLNNRAFILRRLRTIRERQRPCLEACLRFLSEGERSGAYTLDSGSESESELDDGARKKQTMTLMRSHKNMAEPRTSQGTFGPNGELVCFFRSPPRIVQHVLRDSKSVSAAESEAPDNLDLGRPEEPERMASPTSARSPALIADAVRRLNLAAKDRIVKPLEMGSTRHDDDHILRIMTNLLTFSHDTRESEAAGSRQRAEESAAGASAPRRSTVFITPTSHFAGADQKVAGGYVFEADSVGRLCAKNAEVAKQAGRYDHARMFDTLGALFPAFGDGPTLPSTLAVKVVDRLHGELSTQKDIQMLAMLSMIVLQGFRPPAPSSAVKTPASPGDYFSRLPTQQLKTPMTPPTWPRSPPVQLSTSGSSRGSWSSLFNAGTMRQFMSGVQESLSVGTPAESPPVLSKLDMSKVTPPENPHPSPVLLSRRGAWRRDSGSQLPTVSKSWTEGSSSNTTVKLGVSFSSAGNRPSRLGTPRDVIQEHKVVVFEPDVVFEPEAWFPASRFTGHVQVYAEILFSWQMYHKRLELLRAVGGSGGGAALPDSLGYSIGIQRRCSTCGEIVQEGKMSCRNCDAPAGPPRCTVCRLPVKGLSRCCLRCWHVTHITCWRELGVPICPLGCGCLCDGSQ